jgi:5,5'-dehydrodivanillate O-demethylase
MENSVDPSHLQVLHQTLIAGRRTIADTTRGLTDDVAQFDFYEFPHGIMKKRTYKNGLVDEHPLLFPNILRQSNATQIRVPMDDSHTKIFFVRFDATEDGRIVDQVETLPVEYVKPYKNPPDALHPFTHFRMDEVQAQDHMVWETQGPISDRTCERLATADRGVVMLREMMRREIDKVMQGLDPLGVIRDPNHAMIDSKLAESLRGPEYRRELRDVAA